MDYTLPESLYVMHRPDSGEQEMLKIMLAAVVAALLLGCANLAETSAVAELTSALRQGDDWDLQEEQVCQPSVRPCETTFSHRSPAGWTMQIFQGVEDHERHVFVGPRPMFFNGRGVCGKGCENLTPAERASLEAHIHAFIAGRIMAAFSAD